MLLYNTLYYICYFIVLVCYTSRPTLEFRTGAWVFAGTALEIPHAAAAAADETTTMPSEAGAINKAAAAGAAMSGSTDQPTLREQDDKPKPPLIRVRTGQSQG
jgi:hypothetical protein